MVRNYQKKEKLYTESGILKGAQAVIDGKMTIRAAAKEYHCSSTLIFPESLDEDLQFTLSTLDS